jgi:hypothetical protein
MTRSTTVAPALALLAGLGIAALDARAGEVQGAVLLLLAAGAVLGALAPRVAPLSGLLLGAGVPLTYLWMRSAGMPTQSDGFAGTLLAFLPALVGTLGGRMAAARRLRTTGH